MEKAYVEFRSTYTYPNNILLISLKIPKMFDELQDHFPFDAHQHSNKVRSNIYVLEIYIQTQLPAAYTLYKI